MLSSTRPSLNYRGKFPPSAKTHQRLYGLYWSCDTLTFLYPLSINGPNTEPSGQSETWLDDRTDFSGLETLYLLDLLQTSLDIFYSPAKFDKIAAILSPDPAFDALYKRIQLRTCALCAKPHIGGNFQNSLLSWIDQFPARGNYFACCHAKVCGKGNNLI